MRLYRVRHKLGSLATASKKQYILVPITLPISSDFPNLFTFKLNSRLLKSSLKSPPYCKDVATLPCELCVTFLTVHFCATLYKFAVWQVEMQRQLQQQLQKQREEQFKAMQQQFEVCCLSRTFLPLFFNQVCRHQQYWTPVVFGPKDLLVKHSPAQNTIFLWIYRPTCRGPVNLWICRNVVGLL